MGSLECTRHPLSENVGEDRNRKIRVPYDTGEDRNRRIRVPYDTQKILQARWQQLEHSRSQDLVVGGGGLSGPSGGGHFSASAKTNSAAMVGLFT